MDVVGVGKDGATGAKEGLDTDNEGVEAKGEELRPKGAALACATARGDDSRVGAGTADVEGRWGSCTWWRPRGRDLARGGQPRTRNRGDGWS